MDETVSPSPPEPKKQVGEAPTGPGRGWLSYALRWHFLVLFAAMDLSLTAAIVALTVESSRSHGFVTIPDQNTTRTPQPAGVSTGQPPDAWDLSILWTALPSFVFQLFSASWVWIAGAIAERQPYVELRRGRAEAKKSILLDYRVTPLFRRWWRALRLRHGTVATTALAALALQYVVTPLSSRLFAAQAVLLPSEVSIVVSSAFNWTELISATLDWRPVLGTVSATLVHGGNNPPWTDDQYAFRPFLVDGSKVQASGSVEVAANTTAYSAYLSCELVGNHRMTMNALGDGAGQLKVVGTDRGCAFEQEFGVQPGPEVFFQSTTQHDCSVAAYYGRLVFTAGTYSSSSPYLLDNISVISCATGYQNVDGVLEMTLPSPSSTPAVRSFARTGEPNIARTPGWQLVETMMLQAVVFNPSAVRSTSEFGNVALYYAEKLDPARRLAGPVLIRAVERVFTSAYRAAVASRAFDRLPIEVEAAATLRTPTARLVVSDWVAYVVLVFLATALGFVGFVAWHVAGTPSILAEEPEGLLATAGLLEGGDVAALVRRLREQPGYQGGVRTAATRCGEVEHDSWEAMPEESGLPGVWTITKISGQGRGRPQSSFAVLGDPPRLRPGRRLTL